jgi:hypothetical protein
MCNVQASPIPFVRTLALHDWRLVSEGGAFSCSILDPSRLPCKPRSLAFHHLRAIIVPERLKLSLVATADPRCDAPLPDAVISTAGTSAATTGIPHSSTSGNTTSTAAAVSGNCLCALLFCRIGNHHIPSVEVLSFFYVGSKAIGRGGGGRTHNPRM